MDTKFFKGIILLFKISDGRDLVTKKEEEEATGQVISFFYHAYGNGANSLVQTCNQLQKGRTQGSGLVAAYTCFLPQLY